MNEHMESLGRRWVALGLEWMPGMQALGPWRVLTVSDDRYPMSCFATAHHHPRGWWGLAGQPAAARELRPDFADKITELSLLHYVQQAWADPRAYVLPLSRGTTARTGRPGWRGNDARTKPEGPQGQF